MSNQPMPYNAITDKLDRDLLFEFFWKFSFLECKLKRGGYIKKGSDDTANTDWHKFGVAIRGRFAEISTEDFNNAVRKLKELSPRQQIVENEQIGWRTIFQKPHISDEEFMLKLLRAVRNNLFHGGKYPDGPVEEIARDSKILISALNILDVYSNYISARTDSMLIAME